MKNTPSPPDTTIPRRRFFQQIGRFGLTGMAFGVVRTGWTANLPRVRRYKPLGKTGLQISDISFGGSQLHDDPAVVEYAIDRGINYFDTAESYTGGTSETAIGKAIKGKRHRLYLATKGWFGARTRKEEMMRTLEGSLRRLQTDYVDVYFLHAVN
ncbi:MAG: aldo/keto reductase, partial [Nitrospinota bacterium]